MKTSALLPALLMMVTALLVAQANAATVSWIGGSGSGAFPLAWSPGFSRFPISVPSVPLLLNNVFDLLAGKQGGEF